MPNSTCAHRRWLLFALMALALIFGVPTASVGATTHELSLSAGIKAENGPTVTEATIEVTTFDPEVSADGECSLIEAIDNANADSQVHVDCLPGSGADTIRLVSGGVYVLTGVDNTTDGANGLPSITSTITIVGDIVPAAQIAGSNTGQSEIFDEGATIVRDNGLGADKYRLFHIAETGKLILDRIALKNGNLSGSVGTAQLPSFAGGAVLNRGVLNIIDCVLSFNTADHGGAIMNQDATATMNITGSLLDRNVAVQSGGALYSQGKAAIADSTAKYNRAEAWSGGGFLNESGYMTVTTTAVHGNSSGTNGGGIANWGLNRSASTLVLLSRIYRNEATLGGGGLVNASGQTFTATLTIDESVVSENTLASTLPSEGIGGGILNTFLYNASSSLSILQVVQSTVAENRAQLGGGIANANRSADADLAAHLIVDRSTVSENLARGKEPQNGDGGGIYNENGTSLIVNSTLAGNTSDGTGNADGRGGAMLNVSTGLTTTVSFVNSTVADNESTVADAGITNLNQSGDAQVSFVNTLLADNYAVTIEGTSIIKVKANCKNQDGTITSLGYNLEDADTCELDQQSDMTDADPEIGPLTDNGGWTETYALSIGSPAINQGNIAVCLATPVDGVDQRNESRQGTGCDIGSYDTGIHHQFLPSVACEVAVCGSD